MKHFALIAGLSLLLLSIPGSVLAASGSGARSVAFSDTTTAEYCGDTEEVAFLSQINSYRAQNGLPALVMSQTLSAAAYHHSADMAIYNYFSHTLYSGTTWDQNIRDHGYTSATAMAENIAAGSSTASAVMTQWKNSAGHNANMLSASYNAIGIGRAYSSASTYGWYWTTTFGGVQDATAVACAAATPTPTPTATPAPVQSISVFVSAFAGSKTTAKSVTTLAYTLTIKDSNGKVVSGASVTISVTSPKGSTITLSGATSSKGVVKLTTKASSGSGSYVGQIKSITATGKVYDPNRNAMTGVVIAV